MKDITICADAMAGLLQSLAKDVPKIYLKARVNGVAPGAVDTTRFKDECERYGPQWEYEECEATVGMAKPVPPEDVAKTCLFLASEKWSGSTHGQLLHVGKLIAEAMVVGCLLTIFEMAARWVLWCGSSERRRADVIEYSYVLDMTSASARGDVDYHVAGAIPDHKHYTAVVLPTTNITIHPVFRRLNMGPSHKDLDYKPA